MSGLPTTVDLHQEGCKSITSVHSDILQAHVLTRLDGPTLASASSASSVLHHLSSDDRLWKDISVSTWPSIKSPCVQELISTFRSGHKSFYSDSYPLLTQSKIELKSKSNPSKPLAERLISAVDIYYKNEAIFSRVQETETSSRWFRSSPFRAELLDRKESVPTPVVRPEMDEECQFHLEETMTLSWIVIDPTRKRAVNISSLRPVSVQRHWISSDIQVRYATIMAGESPEELVQCGVAVTCGGREGEEMHVREVSMHVEDMDGKTLSGEESLVILGGAAEHGERRRGGKVGQERRRYDEYLEMRRERGERKQRKERAVDLVFITVSVTFFVAFWSYVFLR